MFLKGLLHWLNKGRIQVCHERLCDTLHSRHYYEEVSRATVASVPEAPLLLLDLNSSLSRQEWTILPHLQVSCYFYQRKLAFSITQEISQAFSYTNRNWTCFCSLFFPLLLALQRMLRGYPHDWPWSWAVNIEPKHGLRAPHNRVISKKCDQEQKQHWQTSIAKVQQR